MHSEHCIEPKSEMGSKIPMLKQIFNTQMLN
jgi:hypothetical protein